MLLALILAFGIWPAVFAAEEQFDDLTEYPIILVPGYSSSALYKVEENGSHKHVWGIEEESYKAAILHNIAQLGIGLGALTLGNAKIIADTVGKEFVNLTGDLRCNPDGSSAYRIERYLTTAEEANTANLQAKYGDDSFQVETEMMGKFEEYVGAENLYSFYCDFRMGAVFCAAQLDEFIQSVKDYSGKDKVNLFAVSHGGQVTGTYLTLYGEKGDVNNAVMTVPALGGAIIAYDAMSNQIKFDELTLIEFIEHGFMEETDYHWLVKAQQLGFLDEVLRYLVPYAKQTMLYWGSMWDFIPTEYYEQMKKSELDPVESRALIEKSDYMHYEVMPHYAEGFKRAQQAGARIFIIAGYDNPPVTGSPISSDGIIHTTSSTGATVAPLGQRFADGYVQKIDDGYDRVSPSMTLDASTAYLPDHTFFVENLFHGMTYKDDYTAALLRRLLLTKRIDDVRSDPAFPQFHATTNRSHSVFAAFDRSDEGYLSSDDTTLVVRNLSEKYTMYLTYVEFRGVPLSVTLPGRLALAPGESVSLPLEGTVPAVSRKGFDVVLDYHLANSPTPLGERIMNFTVRNGDPVPFDETQPLVPADYTGTLEQKLPDAVVDLLAQTGTRDLCALIVHLLRAVRACLETALRSAVPMRAA